MQTSQILLNINKKEKKFLLSTNKKIYVILQKSFLRCHQVGLVKDVSELTSDNKLSFNVVNSLKESNFLKLFEQEVKYLDIDHRYKDEDAVYLLVRFKNEQSEEVNSIKNMLVSQ